MGWPGCGKDALIERWPSLEPVWFGPPLLAQNHSVEWVIQRSPSWLPTTSRAASWLFLVAAADSFPGKRSCFVSDPRPRDAFLRHCESIGRRVHNPRKGESPAKELVASAGAHHHPE